MSSSGITRRSFVQGSGLLPLMSLLSAGVSAKPSPRVIDLSIGYRQVNFTGAVSTAVTVNNSLPAPVLRWREGDEVVIRVTNTLPVKSAIHWHGLILPSEMDGVPGLSFDGIPPGGSFVYRFSIRQSGTYWYHSHAGYQEQLGMYGAIIIDPAGQDPVSADREHVVVLSDWSDESPEAIFATLKKNAHVYNRNRRTLGDALKDFRAKGVQQTFQDRAMWNRMRMEDSDLVDVSGYTYTYLMNGVAPDPGWVGGFKAGETVRLRLINAAAMSIFDFRIPGLKLKVVSADGQNVHPVTVDELRLAPAETIDVLVSPEGDGAYTLFAQSIDRSGHARGTLSSVPGMHAALPPYDAVPRLGHQEMGMRHDQGEQVGMVPAGDHHHHGHHNMQHAEKEEKALTHAPAEFGPHVDMRAESVSYRLDDPGIGLRDNGRRVLTYADLKRLEGSISTREPDDEIEIHLTGNMSRYMWSMDGVRFADADPMVWRFGERKRITLVNDTMMNHPIHLHGMWSELETGDVAYLPAKHTVVVQPGSKISYRVTAGERGRWAYHCHMLYHMKGMFREVRVT